MDPSQIGVDVHDANNVVLHHDNALVQFRTGELTRRGLEQIETALRLVRAGRSGPTGAILILAEGAKTPDREVRELQREVINQMLTDERSHAAVVLEGSGLSTSLMRTFARTTMPRNGRLRLVRDADEAVRWIAQTLGRRPEDLRALVERARALAASGAP